jgi:hypothetical protein
VRYNFGTDRVSPRPAPNHTTRIEAEAAWLQTHYSLWSILASRDAILIAGSTRKDCATPVTRRTGSNSNLGQLATQTARTQRKAYVVTATESRLKQRNSRPRSKRVGVEHRSNTTSGSLRQRGIRCATSNRTVALCVAKSLAISSRTEPTSITATPRRRSGACSASAVTRRSESTKSLGRRRRNTYANAAKLIARPLVIPLFLSARLAATGMHQGEARRGGRRPRRAISAILA